MVLADRGQSVPVAHRHRRQGRDRHRLSVQLQPNAPADLLNLVAHVNSLVAYLYGYREQDQIDLPVDNEGRPTVSCGGANTCAVLASGAEAVPCDDARCDAPDGDRVVAYVTTRGNTTYVTYTTEELPLARLIRDVVPFGNAIADISEPLLKVIVDSAYYDNNPIPSDPSRYRPARLMPTVGELADTVSKVPGAIRDGLKALSDKDSDETDVDVAVEVEVEKSEKAEKATAAQTRHERRLERIRARAAAREDAAEQSKAAEPKQDSTTSADSRDTADGDGSSTAD